VHDALKYKSINIQYKVCCYNIEI